MTRASKDLIEIAKNTNPMNFDFMSNIWEQIFDSLIPYKSENGIKIFFDPKIQKIIFFFIFNLIFRTQP